MSTVIKAIGQASRPNRKNPKADRPLARPSAPIRTAIARATTAIRIAGPIAPPSFPTRATLRGLVVDTSRHRLGMNSTAEATCTHSGEAYSPVGSGVGATWGRRRPGDDETREPPFATQQGLDPKAWNRAPTNAVEFGSGDSVVLNMIDSRHGPEVSSKSGVDAGGLPDGSGRGRESSCGRSGACRSTWEKRLSHPASQRRLLSAW